jgi:hypothetical protein
MQVSKDPNIHNMGKTIVKPRGTLPAFSVDYH